MSEQQKNVENLRAVRESLVKRRREKASIAVENDSLGTIQAIIELQQIIDTIDRAIADELKHFDPAAWEKLNQ